MSLIQQYREVILTPPQSVFLRKEGAIIADDIGAQYEIYLTALIGHNREKDSYFIIEGSQAGPRSTDWSCEELAQWLGISERQLTWYFKDLQKNYPGRAPIARALFIRKNVSAIIPPQS